MRVATRIQDDALWKTSLSLVKEGTATKELQERLAAAIIADARNPPILSSLMMPEKEKHIYIRKAFMDMANVKVK